MTTGRGAPQPRVVVLRPLGLGDLLTAVPALRAIRRHWPDAGIVLAAPAWQEPLARLTGVDGVVDTAERGPLPRGLLHPDAPRPDVVVNLHGRGPESTRRALELEPRQLIAFEHPDVPGSAGGAVWRTGGHEVARWCRMLAYAGIETDPTDLLLGVPADPLSPHRGAVVVHPGAAAPARRWPAERFGAVAAALADAGHSVVVVGTASERGMGDAVIAAADRPGVVSLVGHTDLWGLARLVAGAQLFVGNDSGVAHLATATATPSVVLFGPTAPDEWGPPPDGRHVSIWKGRAGDPHGAALDAGLAAISTGEVLDAALRMLAAPPGTPARSAGHRTHQ